MFFWFTFTCYGNILSMESDYHKFGVFNYRNAVEVMEGLDNYGRHELFGHHLNFLESVMSLM